MTGTKLVHRSNYIVYIDDVRVDPFLVNWSSTIGLSANQASATLTFFRSPAMDDWKAYLSKVKIFAENPFTLKYTMVFEGDIISRSWNDKRSNMGTVTFHCAGFYHWLEVKIPMAINHTDEMNPLQRFIYEAQNINIEEVRALVTSDAEVLLKDNNVQGVIDQLFDKITVGYYEAAGEDTNFAFSRIKERFVILSDVKEEFRQSGFLDLFTFSKASYIDSFSAYLVEVVEQLMMEFYQDRDGTMKIKFPGWGDTVLKSHVLDASIVESVSGVNNWAVEPTRVLAVGSATQLQQAIQNRGQVDNILHDLTIPVGLYIGNPRKPETEDYYSASLQIQTGGGGGGGGLDGFDGEASFAGEDVVRGKAISTKDWFDNLPNYPVTSGHWTVNPSRRNPNHMGTDYGTKTESLYNIGTHGVVVANDGIHKSMGWHLTIGQNIDGTYYEFKYMHLNKRSPLKVGQKVAPGQYIGQSGATGGAVTAKLNGPMRPHLHLEIWRGKWYGKESQNLNPEKFLNDMRAKKGGGETVMPGAGGGGGVTVATSRDFSGTNGRFVDPNTIKSWEKNKAFLDQTYPKEADEVVNVNNNVPESVLAKFMTNKLSGGAKYYIQYGNEFGIDPAFCAAISLHETGLGKHVNYNNVGGMMDPSTGWSKLMKFNSLGEGIRAYISNLHRNYIKVGRITPRTIQATYAPKGAGNDQRDLNRHWISGVVKFWNQIRGVVSTTTSDFSPNASMSGGGSGGSGFGLVNYPNSMKRMNDFVHRTKAEAFTQKKIETPFIYDDFAKSKIPSTGVFLGSVINAQAGKLAPALIVSIINVMSRWNQKFESGSHATIMGINKKYLDKNQIQIYKNIPQLAIEKGVELINYERNFRFGGNPFLGLAAVLNGNALEISNAYQKAKNNFYTFVKNESGKDYMRKLTAIMDDVMGDNGFIQGNIHRDMTGKFFSVNGFIQEMLPDGTLKVYDEENPLTFELSEEELAELEGGFEAKLSDEERMFKVNLVQVEQELIRMDSAAISSPDTIDGESFLGNDFDGSDPDGSFVGIGPKLPTADESQGKLTLNKGGKPSKPGPLIEKLPNNSLVNTLNNQKNKGNQGYTPNGTNNTYPNLNVYPQYNYQGGLGSLKPKAMLSPSPFPENVSRSTLMQRSVYSKARELYNEDAPVLHSESIELTNITPRMNTPNENLRPLPTDIDVAVPVTPNVPEKQVLKDIIDMGDTDVKDYTAEIDDLIYQYAKYNMQLHRAMAHDVQVPLTLCLPQLRVGFNMWLEPTRTDLVFYSTGITHSGSFGAGCRTTVSGAFIRDTATYKDVNENVFIGDRHATSEDFGETLPPSSMNSLRNELKALHASGMTSEAHKVTALSKLYASQNKDNKYSTKWNKEYTPETIDSMVKDEYASAPDIIKKKIELTKKAINESVDIFVKMLHAKFK